MTAEATASFGPVVNRARDGRDRVSSPVKPVDHLLNDRSMWDGLVRKRPRTIRLAGVALGSSANPVELLSLAVIGLELFVVDRPRGRHSRLVLRCPKITLTHAIERCAIELGRSTDHAEALRVLIESRLERGQVRAQSLKKVSLLYDQNAKAVLSESVRHGSASGSAAHNNDVVTVDTTRDRH
jgi:hypothetical protein